MKEVRYIPKKKSRKPQGCLTVIAIIFLIALIGSCFGGGSDSKTTVASNTLLTTESDLLESRADDSTISEDEIVSGLTVHFLDVGQGLSILCESDGRYMLYDGGDSSTSSFVVAYLKKQNVEKLDYLIASHYDSDHINGLIGALNVFDVDTIIGPDYVPDSKLYQSFISKIEQKRNEVIHPSVGETFSFGSAEFTVLAPAKITEDANNNSVALKLSYMEKSFIFTGDAGSDSEAKMCNSGINLDCDVLSVGHHGSATCTSWDFLKKTVPEYAVISCGVNNQYGHPDKDVMDKLESMAISVFRTDKQGTIIASTDGNNIQWNVSPCNDYTPGDENNPGTTAQSEAPTEASLPNTETQKLTSDYVLNKSSKKFHYPNCSSVKKIKNSNREEYTGTREDLISQGYSPCGICKP